jgi:hypothetical protein
VRLAICDLWMGAKVDCEFDAHHDRANRLCAPVRPESNNVRCASFEFWLRSEAPNRNRADYLHVLGRVGSLQRWLVKESEHWPGWHWGLAAAAVSGDQVSLMVGGPSGSSGADVTGHFLGVVWRSKLDREGLALVALWDGKPRGGLKNAAFRRSSAGRRQWEWQKSTPLCYRRTVAPCAL